MPAGRRRQIPKSKAVLPAAEEDVTASFLRQRIKNKNSPCAQRRRGIILFQNDIPIIAVLHIEKLIEPVIVEYRQQFRKVIDCVSLR